MKWIYLTKEYYTCVDDDSYEKVKHLLWRSAAGSYARARLPGGKDVFLHSFLVPHGPNLEIDHLNRCRWDNRLSNLKAVPQWINQQNKGIPTSCPLPTEEEKAWAKAQRLGLKSLPLKERGMSKPRGCPVRRPVKNNLGEVFESSADAARHLGVPGGANIAQAAQGNRREAYGLKWEYV